MSLARLPAWLLANCFYTYAVAICSVHNPSLGVLRTGWYEGTSIVRHWDMRKESQRRDNSQGQEGVRVVCESFWKLDEPTGFCSNIEMFTCIHLPLSCVCTHFNHQVASMQCWEYSKTKKPGHKPSIHPCMSRRRVARNKHTDGCKFHGLRDCTFRPKSLYTLTLHSILIGLVSIPLTHLEHPYLLDNENTKAMRAKWGINAFKSLSRLYSRRCVEWTDEDRPVGIHVSMRASLRLKLNARIPGTKVGFWVRIACRVC